jgi:hypothetical protein
MFDEHVMEEVVERHNMQDALNQVRAKKGRPGVDGMSVDDLPDFLKAQWPAIKDQLLHGTYQPQGIKRVRYPSLEAKSNANWAFRVRLTGCSSMPCSRRFSGALPRRFPRSGMAFGPSEVSTRRWPRLKPLLNKGTMWW